MSFKTLPFGELDGFNVVIEISQDSPNKYEYNEELDIIQLNFIFQNGFTFPFNYGYIPETRGGDGDHLDVFVLTSQPLACGTMVECRTLGIIELLDRGEKDDKVLAVPVCDPAAAALQSWKDWPLDLEKLFHNFFQELGRQKNKTMEIKGIHDVARAREELVKAQQIYINQKGA